MTCTSAPSEPASRSSPAPGSASWPPTASPVTSATQSAAPRTSKSQPGPPPPGQAPASRHRYERTSPTGAGPAGKATCTPKPLGSGTITITLPGGPCRMMPFPTGDLEAAFQATGAPDITAYSPVPDDPATAIPRVRYRRSRTPGLPVIRVGTSHQPGRRHRRSVAANRRVLRLYRRRQHPRRRGNSRPIRARGVQPRRGVRRRLRPHHPGHRPDRHHPRETLTPPRSIGSPR